MVKKPKIRGIFPSEEEDFGCYVIELKNFASILKR
jgi:hypothetical protein